MAILLNQNRNKFLADPNLFETKAVADLEAKMRVPGNPVAFSQILYMYEIFY